MKRHRIAKKAMGRLEFIRKLAQRRDIPFAVNWCSIGSKQRVTEVKRAGNGYYYKADRCNGCAIDNGRDLDGSRCPTLRDHYMFTYKEIHPGDTIVVESLLKDIAKKYNDS